MNIIINPGTEPQEGNLENALKAAELFLQDLGLKGFTIGSGKDTGDGWFDFVFKKGEFRITLTFPGSDPEITRLGEPWKSPRMYVAGSSWLWGYGLGMFESKYKDYLMSKEKVGITSIV